MKGFVNISAVPESPFFIRADGLCFVEIRQPGDILLTSRDGTSCNANMARLGLTEPAALLQKLREAGASLYCLPAGQESSAPTRLFDPAAVAYVTLTKQTPDGFGVILAVEGARRFEELDIAGADIETLLATIAEAKGAAKMLRIAPAQATARWAQGGDIYIDTAMVTRITDTGVTIDVRFRGLPGALDIRPTANVAALDVTQLATAELKKGTPLKEAFENAEKANKEAQALPRRLLVRALARDNKNLVDVSTSERSVLVQPDDFQAVNLHTDIKAPLPYILVMHERPDSRNNADWVKLYYKTEQDRAAAMTKIGAPMPSKPAPLPTRPSQGPA